MRGMENWENWSAENSDLPAIIRATVLHAWLAQIHPFIDGNGRTARAITNLELIRAGYPTIIIHNKDRDRYIDALAKADESGELIEFFNLMVAGASEALNWFAKDIKEDAAEMEKEKDLDGSSEARIKACSVLLSDLPEAEREAFREYLNKTVPRQMAPRLSGDDDLRAWIGDYRRWKQGG